MTSHTDLSQLERIYKGDRTRMASWVGIYLEETPDQLQRMAACLERADLDGLLAIVHDLKPTMHYLGAQRIQELLVRLAQEARQSISQIMIRKKIPMILRLAAQAFSRLK